MAAQTDYQAVSSVRLNLLLGTLRNHGNWVDDLGTVPMSSVGDYQINYEHINGPTFAKSVGLGISAGFREVLEGEISFERGLITQKFDFAPAFTYPKAGINQNIVELATK